MEFILFLVSAIMEHNNLGIIELVEQIVNEYTIEYVSNGEEITNFARKCW